MSDTKDVRNITTKDLLAQIMVRAAELSRRWDGVKLKYDANQIWRKADALIAALREEK